MNFLRYRMPKVVYLEPSVITPELTKLITASSRGPVRIEAIDVATVTRSPLVPLVINVQSSPAWRGISPWMKDSLQGTQPYYVPYRLARFSWLRDVAKVSTCCLQNS